MSKKNASKATVEIQEPKVSKTAKPKMSKEDHKAKVLAKRKALADILDFLTICFSDKSITNEEIKEAVKLLRPTTTKQKKEKEDAPAKLKKFLGASGHQNENEIWNKYKIGRQEMSRLRKASAKAGYFVNFNAEVGQYDEVNEEMYKPY